MKFIAAVALAFLLIGCNAVSVTTGESISSEQLRAFFGKHKIDNNFAVALKKESAGTHTYLATIHGYPDNPSVCESLIEPYNRDAGLSVMQGVYYCEVLR